MSVPYIIKIKVIFQLFEFWKNLKNSADLEIIISLVGTYANDENPTDKISPKFRLKWKKISENSHKMPNFHIILAKIGKIST